MPPIYAWGAYLLWLPPLVSPIGGHPGLFVQYNSPTVTVGTKDIRVARVAGDAMRVLSGNAYCKWLQMAEELDYG